jgi:uncharacterized protein DUF6791/ThiF family protein
MSHQLISRNQDLKRLRDEGYGLEVRSGFLLVTYIPYVDTEKKVNRGTLVSELTLAVGDVTTAPSTHVAHFIGEHPCDQNGSKLSKIANSSGRQSLASDLAIDHSFSAKPLSGSYKDYYEKVTTYVTIIAGPAQMIDPSVTAKTFPLIPSEGEDAVFHYLDTASSRAEIGMVSGKLKPYEIAIVGVGGTGAYVLDFVAKTHVQEIHIFDADPFLQHNAFRAPGAPSADHFGKTFSKVAYFKNIYSKMRRGIYAYDYNIDASNIDQLREMDFIFLCIDAGEAKQLIVESLEKFGKSFIDVGMGVNLVDGSLHGILRVTASTPKQRDHFRKRVSFADVGGNEEYNRNIQIAELNALNAAMAVVKWKKLYGFYLDFENEHNSMYTIDGNMLLNEDRGCNEK